MEAAASVDRACASHSTKPPGEPPPSPSPETVSPYLHDRGASVYNPLTGAELAKDSEAWRALGRIEAGQAPAVDPAVLEHLRAERFLIEDVDTESRRTHLLYVSLETCTTCNHRCPFCPVSVDAARDREVMSQELFESIVDEVVAVGGEGRRRLPLELQRADVRSALRGAGAATSSRRAFRSAS